MMTIQKENYGDYSSSNYGSHTQRIIVGNLSLWFSYNTCVAFCVSGRSTKVHENTWGPTTGKHLNWIDGGDKKNRLSHEEFNIALDRELNEAGFQI